MALRILQVASGLRCLAGTEKHVLDLTLALARRGHDVRIAAPGTSPLFDRAGEMALERVALELQNAHQWSRLSSFVRGLTGKYDLIHVHSPIDYLVPPVAARIARIPGVVATRHLPNPFARRSTAYICGSLLFDRIIAVSSFIRGVLIESGVAPERIEVVHNGIDPATADAAAARALREELDIPQDAILVGAAGRLFSEKGFDILLKAIARLDPGEINLYCVVFGEGRERGPLQALAGELGISSRVRLPGFRRDIAALWRAADIGVVPSIAAESFGYVALESLAGGCATIASRIGGLPEILADAAILTEPGDTERLAAAIRLLASSGELRSRMQETARQRSRLFTLDLAAAGVERVYATVLGRKDLLAVSPRPCC